MKNLRILFLLIFAIPFFHSCQKECCELGEEIKEEARFVDGRGSALLNGVVNCINGDPKENVEVKITASDGEVWTQLTDANGEFELDEMPNIEYTIDFSYADDDATAYSTAEVDAILIEMRDFILNLDRAPDFELIDGLIYDVNDSGQLTTLDLVYFQRAYQTFDAPLDWQWRFISLKESATIVSNSFSYPDVLTIPMYNPNATADLEYIAIRAGDRKGVACNN